MSLNEAAQALVEFVHAPKGTVNVLPLNDANGKHLVVWVATNYSPRANSIPQVFEGYPVSVEKKPNVFAF